MEQASTHATQLGVLSRYASHWIMYKVSLSHKLVKFINVTKGTRAAQVRFGGGGGEKINGVRAAAGDCGVGWETHAHSGT